MKTTEWIRRIKNPTLRGIYHIPIYSPSFEGNEKDYLNQCIDTEWISPKGNFVTKFENAFARFVDASHAIAVSSGTAALELSLRSIGIKRGDEVIVPTMTMASTAFVISYLNATPVFVDSEPNTGNLDPYYLEQVITKKTKAILPVHLYGTPCNLNAITSFANKHNLCVVEDAAEAIGSKYNNYAIGSISKLSGFSLYVNKIITTGQGGMITTNDASLAKKIRRINNYNFSNTRHFWHTKVGFNLKLSNLQAAVGLAQIERVENLLTKKKQLSTWYSNELTPLNNRIISLSIPKSSISNHWMIAYILTGENDEAQNLREFLGKNGIESRSFFIPLHLQPVYRNLYTKQLPIAESLCRRGILLPSGPEITLDTVIYITHKIKEYFKFN